MRKINNTWFLRGNPHGKNHELVSKPHSNLESTKCVNRLQPNPGSNHTPTGMSEPSPIACDLRNLIPEATQVLILNKEINTLSEYENIQNAT